MNSTFNAGVDLYGLVAEQNPVLAVKASQDNRTKQSASGMNSYGDAIKVDSYGETAAPSAEYEIIGELTAAKLKDLASVHTPAGFDRPVVLGTITITTKRNTAPTLTAAGEMVQAGAAQLRTYPLPDGVTVTPRHRAQDILGCMSITKGTGQQKTAASDETDYGLDTVTATFKVEITLAQPKGEVKNYDVHGGPISSSYSMDWYLSTPPNIELTAEAIAAGYTMSKPKSASHPEGGYTNYTWEVTAPNIGEEYEEDDD